MRRLASFEDPVVARALREVLFAANIDSDLRDGPERAVTVWVLAEHDMQRAQGILEAFVSRPEAREYAIARALAAQKRAAENQNERVSQPPVVPAPRSLRERITDSPVTFGLIGISIAVALVTELGSRSDLVSHLTIGSFERSGKMMRWAPYRDLLDGEVWRLFTPIFLHFGLAHLLFNSVITSSLGAPTERFQGSLRYVFFILWCAAVSNIAQVWFGGSPTFGGLSGIVYAYVGYLWARGRSDPASGIYLPGRFVLAFVGLMAIGFTGVLDSLAGPIANWAHLGGFVAGVVYGWLAGLRGRRGSG